MEYMGYPYCPACNGMGVFESHNNGWILTERGCGVCRHTGKVSTEELFSFNRAIGWPVNATHMETRERILALREENKRRVRNNEAETGGK